LAFKVSLSVQKANSFELLIIAKIEIGATDKPTYPDYTYTVYSYGFAFLPRQELVFFACKVPLYHGLLGPY
jgi:hypothetical protein